MREQDKPDPIPEAPAPHAAGKKKYDMALSEYTYMVSHNLNAPLRHILQYGELLKSEAGGHLGTNELMYVDNLIASAKRLQRLVNDLLSYAQILHIKEEKKYHDLNEIVAEAVKSLAGLIEENSATIHIKDLPVLPVYRFRMVQLFNNLIENAIKYRDAEAPVITIESVDEGTHYLFLLRDNGIGIPREHHKSIFGALKRLHAPDEIDGSGLGLAICEKAVEAHGGKIWVEECAGGGSVFLFTLPKHKAKNPR